MIASIRPSVASLHAAAWHDQGHKVPPGRPALVTDVDVRLPSHLTASGRAILAGLPAAQVRALFPSAATFADRTGTGPRSLRELRGLLREARRRGYAARREELATAVGRATVELSRRLGARPA